MPSTFAEPTVQELLDAFEAGVRAQRDKHVDAREGAIHQHFSGPAAILWSRAARRTTDLWRAVFLDSAEGIDLTRLLSERHDFDRIEDSYGTGEAVLRRPTTAAADGTIWQGTRIAVYGSVTERRFYVVSEDVEVGASDVVAKVPIRAEKPGPGVALTGNPTDARVDDPLWDTKWTVSNITCADGTSLEPAPIARARFRDARRAARAGFVESIIQACKDVGAAHAVLFPSDYAGDDSDAGLNMAYVGDAGYQGTDALVRRVVLALEGYRVLGDNLQVRPLAVSALTIEARVYLWDSPGRFNQTEIRRLLQGAVAQYFGATSGFSYERDALAGAMLKACPDVQFVEFDTPSSDAGVVSTVGGRLNFPATLSRYVVRPDDITLSLLPPQ